MVSVVSSSFFQAHLELTKHVEVNPETEWWIDGAGDAQRVLEAWGL